MTEKEAIEWIKQHHDTQMDNCKDSQAMRKAIECIDLISKIKVIIAKPIEYDDDIIKSFRYEKISLALKGGRK